MDSKDDGEHASPQYQHHRRRSFGGNPLAHAHSNPSSVRLPALGAAFQPGLYKPPTARFANPVPLGLSGFAMTTFLLSLVNLGVLGVSNSAIILGPAYVYGGLIQLLAGMWDIALGNTFGGTALTSYGGFWISTAIILTPGGFGVKAAYADIAEFNAAYGLYIFAWFIFTFLLFLCTLKSTVAFCSLMASVTLVFLCTGVAYVDAVNDPLGLPNRSWQKAAGGIGVVASALAWYNMLAGLAEVENSFFVVPVVHFPWSEKARLGKAKRRADDEGEMGDF